MGKKKSDKKGKKKQKKQKKNKKKKKKKEEKKKNKQRKNIETALTNLSPREKSIFVLRHYHDLPLKEIAISKLVSKKGQNAKRSNSAWTSFALRSTLTR